MSQPDAPKIEFPCPNYPIKVVGKGVDGYEQIVADIIRVHAPDLDLEIIKVKESSHGRFRSITVYITATGVQQLENIHRDLSSCEHVHMVM